MTPDPRLGSIAEELHATAIDAAGDLGCAFFANHADARSYGGAAVQHEACLPAGPRRVVRVVRVIQLADGPRMRMVAA